MPPNTPPELSANVRYYILCFIAPARKLKRRAANPFGSRIHTAPRLCTLWLPLLLRFFTFYYTMPQPILNPRCQPPSKIPACVKIAIPNPPAPTERPPRINCGGL